MRSALSIEVKESTAELRKLQKRHVGKFKVLQMLLLLKKQGSTSKQQLALLTGASDKSIQNWRAKYLSGGVDIVLQERRGGKKQAVITAKAHQQLAKRLNNPKGGFRSFIEIQQWLATEFEILISYHAVNKYVKRKFGAKLKVGRKSHIQKDPAAEAGFKKPLATIRAY